MRKIGIVCCLVFIASALATAQPAINELIKKTNDYNTNRYQEKIFAHLDRSFYLTGETAWFKVYLVDGIMNQPATTSTVVYVEILDRDNTPIIQTKVSIENGIGNGSIALPASLGSENYVVRAYTNWMKNFDSNFYYHQTISIVNPFRSLLKQEKKADIKLDIQLFPEGGQLVDGIRSRVACRVVSEAGFGVDYHGAIVSAQGDTIVRFKPLKFGIGNFEFKPDLNESYQVVINHQGKKFNAKLPAIQSSGYVMQVTDTSENRFYIKVRSKGKEGATQIHLIAHTRQVVKITSTQNLVNGSANFMVDKSVLGKGISSLTIFNSELKPISERLVFIQPNNKIPVSIASEKSTYAIRNKIQLTISPKEKINNATSLSLAVYKNDSLQNDVADIQSSLWLTSELKGNIENPGYYFSDANTSKAIDNLMLTHGWSRFSWGEIEKPSESIKFLPELRGHLVLGTVKDRTTRNPMQGVTTYLAYPDKSIQVFNDITGTQGDFLFETRNLVGKRKLIIQTSQPDSLIRIEVISPYSNLFSSHPIPTLSITNEMANPLTARSISMQVSDAFKLTGKSKLTNDSSTFYGKPSEHYDLDDYTRFPVMEEVMREYVKGVRLRKKDGKFIFRVNDNLKGAVFDNEPLVLLDGVPVFNTDKFMTMDPLKVKSIDVMTGKYYLGALSFDGVVSYKTYTHDLDGYQVSSNTFTFDYEGLQAQKEFFSPRYETKKEQESRLPDARHLLFWAPNITLFNEQKLLDFYASDQPGTYKAVLQGISEDGNPIVEQCRFTVSPLH